MHRPSTVIAATLLVTACTSAPATLPAAAPTTTNVVAAPPTTRPRPSTTTVTTTAPPPATTVAGAPALSPDGPWRLVGSAPGVTQPGLVYELMPRLWAFLPVEIDPMNGVTWALTEDNRPIIEAYLQARMVFFRAAEQRPIDLDDPGWAQWYTDAGKSYHRVLSRRSAEGQAFDPADGVVLRPVILPWDREDGSVVIFDCQVDGGVWRLMDGSISSDSVAGVIENGVSAVVRSDGSRFRIDGLANDPRACA